MHDDRTNGDDGRLERHRQSHAQMRHKNGGIRLPVRPARMQSRYTPPYIDPEEERTDTLRENRRECRARDSPAKHEDGNWFEYDVDAERNGEQNRRHLAVTERTNQAVLQIEQKEDHKPCKDNRNEVIRSVQNLGRCLHQDEQRPCQRQDNRRQCECHRHAEQDTRRCTLAHPRMVTRAEALPRVDRDTRTEPHDEAQRQKHEAACAADRRERIDPKETSDNERINKGIELLHHIARNKRQCEKEDEPCGLTLRHILCHSRYLVTKMRSFSWR